VPGIIHVAVNFTKPGCVIPVHQDKVDRINDRVLDLVPTVIGIRIPSESVEVVGFEVDRERIYIGEGDIVSFLPEQHHGSWNNSEEWRVTLYITTERQYWSI
jgi:aspartyl/asparaginyl beta-hydroxylase (cupin superfamily)